MKTLYIECNMGAAGDMLMAALLELHNDPEDFIHRLNNIGIPNVSITAEKSVKCGITGTHISVKVNGEEENENMYHHHHHHHHSHLKDIEHIVGHLNIEDNVKADVMSVYRLIAEAESHAHNCTVEEIHFHEVGTMDAIADITGVCMLINEIRADKIIASPINTGKGTVKCAHGILPVPAPATAYILNNVPIYCNNIIGELCTPTGAALIKCFANEFGSMPVMKISKIGYGMGNKDFEEANCVRVFLGETESSKNRVTELLCNIDDMTGERIGFAINRLFEGGALEVFTTAVGMKKNRPGILLTCICTEDKKEDIIRLIFKHTSTIGIRENIAKRYVLNRSEKTVTTPYGDVRIKVSEGYGVIKEKPEYNDLEKIAVENNIDISEIL